MFDYEKIVEIFFSISLSINAAVFIPQLIKLYKTKNPGSLSFLTFLGFNFMQLFGTLHCYLKNDYWPMFGWAASLIICGCITVMIVFYKLNRRQYL